VTDGIVVAGAGRMGIGIAQTFAYAGFDVALADLKPRTRGEARGVLDAAAAQIAANLAALADVGVMEAGVADTIGARVRYVDAAEAGDALADARFVFEAVPEVRLAKREAFGRISAAAPPGAIVASTTSSFLVDTLAGDVPGPERFLNTHWLNPAYLMPLVEVSPGAATSAATLDAAMALLREAGKVPVQCAPSPGYIVPRIQALAMNEAARLVEEGVASPEDVDTASRLGFGLRFAVLGLLEFIDWGGADILYHASEYLHEELGQERFAAAPSVVEHMRDGRIGMKTGSGFYDFSGRDVAAYQRETIARFVGLLNHLGLLPPPAPRGSAASPGRRRSPAS
jgi:3-hydroxybutyryl-CoA dehydrogenase